MKTKVILQIKDSDFSARLKGILKDTISLNPDLPMATVSQRYRGNEILILDHLPMDGGFWNTRLQVIFAASRYSQKKEFLAARLGAKGFITKDLAAPLLLKAVDHIAANELWMTRTTISRIFEEYAKLLAKLEETTERRNLVVTQSGKRRVKC